MDEWMKGLTDEEGGEGESHEGMECDGMAMG